MSGVRSQPGISAWFCQKISSVVSGRARNLQLIDRFRVVDSVQSDETERIGGETSEAIETEGATKDSRAPVAEKSSDAPIEAVEEVPLPKAEQKSPPAQVRVCMFACPPFCLLESSSRRHFVRIGGWLCIALPTVNPGLSYRKACVGTRH